MSLVSSHSVSNAERTGELLSLAPSSRSEDTLPDARGGSFIRDFLWTQHYLLIEKVIKQMN